MPNIPLTPNESAIASDTLARLGVAWSLLTREKWDDSAVEILADILGMRELHLYVANVSRMTSRDRAEQISRLRDAIAGVTPTTEFKIPRIPK